MDGHAARRRDDEQAEADRAVTIRIAEADRGGQRAIAALVVRARQAIDAVGLRHFHGDDVAEGGELPGEEAEGLRAAGPGARLKAKTRMN